MVWVFILMDQNGYIPSSSALETHLDLTVWGGFLILAAWLVGTLSEKRKQELQASQRLCEELDLGHEKGPSGNRAVRDHVSLGGLLGIRHSVHRPGGGGAGLSHPIFAARVTI